MLSLFYIDHRCWEWACHARHTTFCGMLPYTTMSGKAGKRRMKWGLTMHGIVNCFSQSLLFTHCCLILAILLLCGVDEVELLCITVLSLVTLVFQNIVIKLQICYVLDTATNKIVIHFRPTGCAAYCNACSFGHFLPEM